MDHASLDTTVAGPGCARARHRPSRRAGRRGRDHRHRRRAGRDHHHPGQPAPGTTTQLRRRDQQRRAAIDAMVGAAHRAAEEGAQHPADHHRRRRLRRAEHLRRRHPDADHGPHRQERPALQQHPFDGAVLADARGADHRPQPSLGRLRRHLRAIDRLPWLQQHHSRGQGDHRPDPPRQRLCDGLVRQGPQHPGLRRELGRAVRPVADRHGLRIFLRVRGWRRQPVAAEPLPQHHPDLPLRRQARLEHDHGDGRRRHRLPQPSQPDAAGQAVLHQVCPRRDACPAPSRPRSG